MVCKQVKPVPNLARLVDGFLERNTWYERRNEREIKKGMSEMRENT